ncbi:hypothetical protein MKW98_021904 [Papaver atlanticum]|uniref:Fe2OG dioxygenase domain-containing protein n=1 Tax=Papaver atlanticum TaxID=357466 RepID=A0AAD4XZX1_9MAGN|nr:hypothetical protein MKW98_021904 [Papaver atlanticum]
MSVERSRSEQSSMQINGSNGTSMMLSSPSSLSPQSQSQSHQRLRLNPNTNHIPENYEDLPLDFNPCIFTSLERYLPLVDYMKEILARYHSPQGERIRVQKHREYRQKIIESYQPLHRELYSMNPETYFVPSFVEAINKNTEQMYTFEMLRKDFCDMLLSEVDNFEKWVTESNFKIMRPNSMNKYGAVLDDFGFETMLDKLMDDFVRPISKVFFHEVGGDTLDSHHGFVVEYGKDRDVDFGFHVDDSEVTLNVCLGEQFSGGDLYFRGIRCDKHVNTEYQPEESFHYSHVIGQAVGRHRYGARATRSGARINLLLWCRSSAFRELKKYQKEFSAWCGECQREKRERQRLSVAATKLQLLRRQGDNTAA